MSIEPQTHNPSREMDVDGNQFCDCGDYYPCPTVILQDLIAGLQVAIDDYEPRMHGSARAYLLGIRDRAEARLREVDG